MLVEFDCKQAIENIKAFNDSHGMDKEVRKLMELYDRTNKEKDKTILCI